jgi:hypothetical protein
MTVLGAPEVVRTVAAFTERWHEPPNFQFSPELFRPTFAIAPCEEVLDVLRRDERTRITVLGDEPHAVRTSRSAMFRTAPLEQVTQWPFRLVNFDLWGHYDGLLRGFQEQVMTPWRLFLTGLGFTWHRCYPVLFISSGGCSSTYHVDNSHGLVWQVEGTKRFHSFREPGRYAPTDAAVHGEVSGEHPPPHPEDDLAAMDMHPGDLLWSHVLTPHWVRAESPLTLSINFSHGGLQHRGRFAPRETALRRHWDEHPAEPWTTGLRQGRY